MTLEDSIHSQRLHVLRDAIRLGNVSEACRRHGMSRTLFYRLRQRLEQYGPDGVHPKRRRARPGRPPTVSVQTERRVIALAIAWPTCGPQWYCDQLAREGVTIAPVTVWRLLRRQGLGTRRARLAVLERASAAQAGLLTERTVKPARHVAAAQQATCCRSIRSTSAISKASARSGRSRAATSRPPSAGRAFSSAR